MDRARRTGEILFSSWTKTASSPLDVRANRESMCFQVQNFILVMKKSNVRKRRFGRTTGVDINE